MNRNILGREESLFDETNSLHWFSLEERSNYDHLFILPIFLDFHSNAHDTYILIPS